MYSSKAFWITEKNDEITIGVSYMDDALKVLKETRVAAEDYINTHFKVGTRRGNLIFELIDYVYEVHYNGLQVLNSSYYSSDTLDEGVLGFTKIKSLADIEQYLLTFENVPTNFMLNDNFSINISDNLKQLTIDWTSNEQFSNISSVIDRNQITKIKCIHNQHIWEIDFANENDELYITCYLMNYFMWDIEELSSFLKINGYFTEDKFHSLNIVKKVDSNNYIEILGGSLLATHVINESATVNDLKIRVNSPKETLAKIFKGSFVNEAVEFREYDGDLILFEEHYNYHNVLSERFFDDSNMDIDNGDKEVDEFWEGVDNRLGE